MKPRVKISTQLSGQDFRIVKNNGVLDKDAPLLFTFSNFKMSPINIDLPLLSNEKYSLFNDPSKTEALHLHQLHGKEDILQKIFTAYHFGEQAINNFIEGAEIYQLEVPYENGATRIVFERIDNLISFLFLDEQKYNNTYNYKYEPNITE